MASPTAARKQPLPTDRIGLYVAASKAIVSAKPEVDPINDADPPKTPTERAERYSLKRRETWLKANAAGFALFRRAMQAPHKPPGLEASGPNAFSWSNYGSLRQLARYKMTEAHTLEMRGDAAGAARCQLDVLQLGLDTGRGGPLISSLVAVAIQAIGRGSVWEVTEKLTLPQTRAAITRLQTLHEGRLQFVSVLESEKRYGLNFWRHLTQSPDWRGPENWSHVSPALQLKVMAVTPEALLERYTRSMDRQIALARLPYAAPRQEVPPEPGTLDEVLFTNWESARFNYARNDVGNAVWLAALALRAHRLERGSYPATLRALVPAYLRRVPVDPFSGVAPLRYRRTGATYRLWSIGPDGIDNNGRPVAHRIRTRPTPGEKPRLPFLSQDSKGDFVAGKNR